MKLKIPEFSVIERSLLIFYNTFEKSKFEKRTQPASPKTKMYFHVSLDFHGLNQQTQPLIFSSSGLLFLRPLVPSMPELHTCPEEFLRGGPRRLGGRFRLSGPFQGGHGFLLQGVTRQVALRRAQI